MKEFAKNELKNWLESEDEMSCLMAKNILELIDVFCEQGHSGFSAPIAINYFYKLAMYKPLSPLTGENDEWMEVGDGLYQNKRCYTVFKDKDGRAYNSEGKIFSNDNGETWYRNRDSKVYIDFPYTVPDKPEKVFVERGDE